MLKKVTAQYGVTPTRALNVVWSLYTEYICEFNSSAVGVWHLRSVQSNITRTDG